jgi:hypothetical protein
MERNLLMRIFLLLMGLGTINHSNQNHFHTYVAKTIVFTFLSRIFSLIMVEMLYL